MALWRSPCSEFPKRDKTKQTSKCSVSVKIRQLGLLVFSSCSTSTFSSPLSHPPSSSSPFFFFFFFPLLHRGNSKQAGNVREKQKDFYTAVLSPLGFCRLVFASPLGLSLLSDILSGSTFPLEFFQYFRDLAVYSLFFTAVL